MLAGLATWVIVGHSERRRDAGETDELIGRKLGPRGRAGPPPDPVRRGAARRSRGRPGRSSVVDAPARAARSPATTRRASRAGLVIAYEPVWAIGTGRNASGADAAAMADAIRAALASLGWGAGRPASRCCTAAASRSANIGEFLAEPAIDGALVGGASLKPDEMAGIVGARRDDRPRPRPRAP